MEAYFRQCRWHCLKTLPEFAFRQTSYYCVPFLTSLPYKFMLILPYNPNFSQSLTDSITGSKLSISKFSCSFYHIVFKIFFYRLSTIIFCDIMTLPVNIRRCDKRFGANGASLFIWRVLPRGKTSYIVCAFSLRCKSTG
ncbi:hypothetical protein TPE_1278 [Treponema pedis str. T A4]|uniref:Uncharacterized protein n=1 Tax=Treponema pedis str. T A4 TaxID=1291379 RepID=S5ZZN3_9SPIR|nr:hypothetical protein TPE_1278 [Treponema pedis str. T A4]